LIDFDFFGLALAERAKVFTQGYLASLIAA
jgi:hypothetical protein